MILWAPYWFSDQYVLIHCVTVGVKYTDKPAIIYIHLDQREKNI